MVSVEGLAAGSQVGSVIDGGLPLWAEWAPHAVRV